MTQPLVRIRGVEKSFGSAAVLRGIDLDVEQGEVVVLIGASGSGKTTLLRCVNALETYDKGSIQVNGVEIGYDSDGPGRRPRGDAALSKLRGQIGMVFQQFNLFPHLNARDNVALGLRKTRDIPKVEAYAIAERWLTRVGLAEKFEAMPIQLSGGQQQRVGIARAVAMEPKLLLLDEITSALDPELVGEVLTVVRDLADEGMTMLVVTHEMSFARDVGDRIIFMDSGRIAAEGPPDELLNRPTHDRLRQFLARIELRRPDQRRPEETL
jgi:polar amino acid transport system ATP-binding protein